jgi:hypothetical protein
VIERGDIRWFRFALVVAGPRDSAVDSGTFTGLGGFLIDRRRSAERLLAQPEWIRIVERRHLGPLIASLPDSCWSEVRAALLDVLSLEG